MSIDVNVQNDLVIVTESSEDITVNVSNAAGAPGPAGANGVGVPTGGSTGQVLKKFTNTDYDTYWALDGGGVPYSGATGDVNLGEFQLRAGQLTLDTSPTGTAIVGTTRWNDTIGSSETTLKGGSVILKNGVDLVARVVNKVSPNATLTKAAYQAVRVSGAQGQRLAVAYAQANNDANSADTIGLVCETIPTNQEGFIMTMGQIENINTTGSLQGETWVDGDVLYLSPTTPGAITKVKPTGNGHIVVIGYVEYAHQNNGKIYVKVMNGWELDELHDVDIVSPANNEALIYESSTALWKNKTIATALGYTPISGTGVTGQVAYWNGTNSQTGSNNLTYSGGYLTNTNTATDSAILIIRPNQSVYQSFIGVGTVGAYSPSNLFWSFGLVPGNQDFNIQSFNGTTVSSRIKIFASTGNISLNAGATTDGGQRLQVYGDAFIKGNGDTSATNALLIQNSLSNPLFRIPNNGGVIITAPTNTEDNNTLLNILRPNAGKILTIRDRGSIEYGNNNFIYPTAGDVNATISRSTSGLFVGQTDGSTTTASIWNLSLGRPSNINNQPTIAVDGGLVQVIGQFNPTSGTAIFTSFRVIPTINQTGGANGITRGLYVNPTLTAAADWRSIEWSNNSGWGLYGAGTANNYLGGRLGIGNTNPTNILDILVNANSIQYVSFKNNSSGVDASGGYIATNNNNQNGGFLVYSSTFANSIYANNLGIGHNKSIVISTDTNVASGGTSKISFVNGGYSVTPQMTLTAAGRLLLGLTAESTFLLDVNGTARVKGTGTTSATSALTIQNSAGTETFKVRDNGSILIASGTLSVDAMQGYTSGHIRINRAIASQSTSSINASAQFEIESTTQGFLPPRMTTTQKNAIASPTAGLMVYDTTLNKLCVYTTAWETITSI